MKKDADTVLAIVDRLASQLYMDAVEQLQLQVQLLLVHTTTCPLMLDELLQAERTLFYRDVLGIASHFCPATGKERKRGKWFPIHARVTT